MSKLTYRYALTIALVLGMAACAGPGAGSSRSHSPPATARAAAASSTSSPTPTRSSLSGRNPCLKKTSARYATVGRKYPLPIAMLGHSSRVVVLVNQSDEFLCSWMKFAHRLTDHGYQVILYNLTYQVVSDLSDAATYAVHHGAKSITLMGASQGAKGVLVAASRTKWRPHRLDDVVALSPEARLQGTDVAAAVKGLESPTLLVTAKNDPYGSAMATQSFMKTAPPHTARRMVVPGNDHGTALLTHPKVRHAVLSFLATHTR